MASPGTSASQNGLAFDVEAAIQCFLADPGARTLDLPHMTPAERKDAKRIVEAHHELSCESFGFGADRKLMLLKRKTSALSGAVDSADGRADDSSRPASALSMGLVKIKNTFIDDWDVGASGCFERALTNSMPAQLRPSRSASHVLPLPLSDADDCDTFVDEGAARSLYRSTPPEVLPSRTPSHVLSLPVTEDDCGATPTGSDGQALYSSTPAQLLPSNTPSHMLLLPPSVDDECDDVPDNLLMPQTDDEDDCGTNASGPQLLPSESICMASSPPTPLAEKPSLDAAVGVRNTFIHIHSAFQDERAVQSMPHGMFAKALLESAATAARAPCVRAVEEEENKSNERKVSRGALASEPCAASVSSPPPAPPVVLELQPANSSDALGDFAMSNNTVMVIEGLSKCPEFNGCLACVQYFEVETGRYSVIITGYDGRQQQAKVKPDNLRHIPSPYHFAPDSSLHFSEYFSEHYSEHYEHYSEHDRPNSCRGPSRILKLDAIV